MMLVLFNVETRSNPIQDESDTHKLDSRKSLFRPQNVTKVFLIMIIGENGH